MPPKRYVADGRAEFRCDDHGRSIGISWRAGYPPIELPSCADGAHPMVRVDGPDPADPSLLEDEPEPEPEPVEEAAP
jgi:hypothetical protein